MLIIRSVKVLVPFVLCILMLSSTAGNISADQNPPYVDKWVEQLDMSKYNENTPIQVQEPGEYNISKNTCIKYLEPADVTKAYNFEKATHKRVNEMDGSAIDVFISRSIIQDTGNSPNVHINSVAHTWYWVRDTWFSVKIWAKNIGDQPADGYLWYWSEEDHYAYGVRYTNLAPGQSITKTFSFWVASWNSVGRKPVAVEATVDGIGRTHYWALGDGQFEKFNNDSSHLPDPDGGQSLESNDLYHMPIEAFPEGYYIMEEAAKAGDDTYNPYDTAKKINGYVNWKMTYVKNNDTLPNTCSDIWIRDHGYIGVCDEFSTLFVSFNRTLGVPARYYYITMVKAGTTYAHGISEIWDGGTWVHADPTWNSYNNPQVYKQAGYTHIKLWRMSSAWDTNYTGEGPSDDGKLHYWYDFGIREYLGELARYN